MDTIFLNPNEFVQIRIVRINEEGHINEHMRQEFQKLGEYNLPVYITDTTIGISKSKQVVEYFVSGEFDELFRIAEDAENKIWRNMNRDGDS
ncbi:hypothetical protein ACTVOX_05290 [Serratia marcescens]|uniref:hypothetical protein n=1 Tax=Serratia marcescens TaxID=615 RepID=UPI003FA7C40A